MQRAKDWFLSFLLILPACVPYLTHLLVHQVGTSPTGFLQIEMPFYLAQAREYFDGGSFHLFCGNSSSPFYDTPRIYFQPHFLLWGLVGKLTGWDPGVVLLVFSIVTGLGCARIALALYREIVGLRSWAQRAGLVAFFWGGGLLALAGLAAHVLTGSTDLRDLFQFDPGEGWWFQNFGRHLVTSATDGLYHALFFACILSVIRRRFRMATLFSVLLITVHPWTSLELLAIVCAWASLEVVFVENQEVPRAFCWTMLALLIGHLGYYVGFWNLFPEHRAIFRQAAVPVLLQARHFIPAYLLVGGLAWWSVRRLRLARVVLASSRNRLFLVWAVVAFILANHEFAITPIQPIHFSGYIWDALFLLGAPQLVALFDWSRLRLPRRQAAAVLALILAVLLSDNALWLGSFPFRKTQGVRITQDQRALFRWMSEAPQEGTVVLSEDACEKPLAHVGYLVTTYTPLRSWVAHYGATPDIDRRRGELCALFRQGQFQETWNTMRLLVVFTRPLDPHHPPGWLTARGGREAFRNGTYTIFQVDPRGLP